jgi:biopolymer transport protein ExbB/TolQ
VQFFLQLLLSWALSLLQLFSLLQQLDLAHDVEQQLLRPADIEHELKNNEKLNNEININDFFIKNLLFFS